MVVRALHSQGRLPALPYSPDVETYLVHREPLHSGGREFSNAKEIGKRLFVEANLNSTDIRKKVTKLLDVCRIDPATVKLRVG